MNSFTIYMAAKSDTINSNSIKRLSKRKMMLKNVKIKYNELKLTQTEVSKQL